MLKPNAIRPGTQHEADTRALQRAALLRLSRLTVDTQAVLHAPSLDERFAALERTRDEVDQRYLGRMTPPGYYPFCSAHNFGFLSYSAAMQGRSAEALRDL